jgi:hypothetical protein
MKNKLEIVARLLKSDYITVEEASLLLESNYVPNYQPLAPNYQPIADWTYRPGEIYCGTTQTSNTQTTNPVSGRIPEYGC